MFIAKYNVFREGKQLEKLISLKCWSFDLRANPFACCMETKEPKGKVLLKVPATDSFSHLCTSTWVSGIIFLNKIWNTLDILIALDRGQSPSMICLPCQKRNRAAAPEWMMNKPSIYQWLGDFSWIFLQHGFARSTNQSTETDFTQKGHSRTLAKVHKTYCSTPSYPQTSWYWGTMRPGICWRARNNHDCARSSGISAPW